MANRGIRAAQAAEAEAKRTACYWMHRDGLSYVEIGNRMGFTATRARQLALQYKGPFEAD